jgi:hypothetical protein
MGAFIYGNGSFTALTGPSGATSVTAFGIGNSGTVVGAWYDASGFQRGFTYSGGQYTSFSLQVASVEVQTAIRGISLDGRYTAGTTVNASSLYSGFTTDTGTDVTRPFVNDPAGGLGFITMPGPAGYAAGLNNRGSVVGFRLDSNDGFHGWLATPVPVPVPVPEPAAVWLMCAGVGLIALRRGHR